MSNNIGPMIRQRREELGLTLGDVARACGVSNGTVCRWESGDIDNMKRDKIYFLAKALHMPLEKILGLPCKEEVVPSELVKKREALCAKVNMMDEEDLDKVNKIIGVFINAGGKKERKG